jgi:iron complex transport system permease protein
MQQAATRTLLPTPRRWTVRTVSVVGLVVVLATALAVGTVGLTPGELLGALGRGLQGRVEGAADVIVWQVRLPRVLLAAAVGAALALAGTAYQAVFRNPLADPYLLGAASGAGFGAAAAMILAPATIAASGLGVGGAAFLAALATVTAVVTLARRGGRLPIVSLILAGVVLGSSLSAATSFVMLADRERTAGVLSWLLGSFAFASWRDLAVLGTIVAVALPAALAGRRAFDLLSVGEDSARLLGLPVEGFKWTVVVLATLLTAAAVAVAGVIGFVGLIVPHAVRLVVGPEHRELVPLAALWGAAFLVLADLTARTVLGPGELPVGVVTALVGGPFFLVLLRRGREAT